MIDAGEVEHELQQARATRLAAEAACSDIEEMLEDLERSRHRWQLRPSGTVPEPHYRPLLAA